MKMNIFHIRKKRSTLKISMEFNMSGLSQVQADQIGDALISTAADLAAKLQNVQPSIDPTKLNAGLAAVQALDVPVAPAA
jgi:hypothetical protein